MLFVLGPPFLESGFSRLGWTHSFNRRLPLQIAGYLIARYLSGSLRLKEWDGLPFRTLPVGFTLHRFWFHRRCPRMRSEAHTKCLCWIVPGSRATFSASCTIFGEIQRSHSPTDDGRDRARFLHNDADKRALTSFE